MIFINSLIKKHLYMYVHECISLTAVYSHIFTVGTVLNANAVMATGKNVSQTRALAVHIVQPNCLATTGSAKTAEEISQD